MRKFPLTIYVTRIFDEDGDGVEYIVDEAKEKCAEENDEDVEVAVYKLFKVGSVVKQSKIVFE